MTRAMPITRAAGRLLVIFLRIAAMVLTLAGIGILFARSAFMPISKDMFGVDAPLMNSAWVDLILRPIVALPIVLLVVAFLYLRSNIISESHKLVADLAYTAAIAGWISMLLLGLYAPAL